MMIIEIHGGGFKNKGAELMLVSVIKAFSDKYPDVKFCINPTVHDDSESCNKYGLLEYFKIPKARGGRLFPIRFLLNRFASKIVPRKFYDDQGVVRFCDVDALIDISGVRFSDKASTTAGKNFIQLARYFRQQGKPVILLPQMFGPFDNSESSTIMRDLEPEVSLIFARDQVSFDYVTRLLPHSSSIFRSSDITITTKSTKGLDSSSKTKRKYGCIVPNVRMLDRGDSGWSSIYVERLALAASKMHAQGIEPVILVHSVDCGEDQPLAEAIKTMVGENICSIKFADDPLETKSFISGSQLVVGSRYHSIVSALSSGVPAVVMGWAHKYETILDDFDMSGFIHNVNDNEKHLSEMLDRMLNTESNNELRNIISKKIETIVFENEEMWNKVYKTLNLPI